MGTKIRLTALILAASLTMNMVIMPVKAEDIAAPIEQLESEPVESIAAQTESSEPTSPTTESSEPTSPTTESSEPTSPTTESSEPTSPTTESSEPGAGEESSDLPEQLLTPEEEETLLEETGGSMLFSTLTRATDDISEQLEALAAENAVSLAADQEIEIRSGAELYFLANSVKPEIYQNCVLKFTNSQDGFDVSGYDVFPGLGTAACPFNGTIAFADGSKTEFMLKKPLFQCLYDSAQMPELILHYAEESSNTPVALFAQEVKRDPNSTVSVGSPVEWSFTLQGDALNKDVKCTPPLIGIIEAGSSVRLGLTDLINLPVETAGNAGLLCGTLNGSLTLTSLSKREPISVKATDAAGGLVGEMGSGAELTVQVPELNVESVSAANGNAGGLVGKMCGGATLTVAPVTVTDSESGSPATSPAALSVNNVTATSTGNAGGLVGEMDNGAVLNVNASLSIGGTISATADSAGGLVGKAQDVVFTNVPVPGSGTVTGVNAGGLIGSYTYSGVSGVLSTVSQNISGITVNGSSNAGGVFGVLNNTSESGTFAISANTVSTTLETSADVGNAGGLIGQYSAGDLSAALKLTSPSVSPTLSGNANAYGGLIGWVSGGPAYLELSGSVALTGTAKNYGGLIGSLYDSNEKDSGHMVVVNDVTITKKVNGTIKGTETAGGLIGYQPHGVLKLSGDVTVDAPDCDKKAYLGNILGRRDNTLVYSTSQWKPRGGGKNDIGNWGQVLSIVTGGVLDGLITEENHTVMVNNSDCSTSIGTPLDFARIALGLQLETKGALVVTPISGDLNITLTSDIDLSGTGLTGFQRDVSVTACGVTLNGGGHTITLPGIKTYVNSGAHDYQGLFSKVTNLTAGGLTISGSGSYTEGETTTSNVGIQLECNGNFYVGGLAANASGNITLTSVIAGASIITNNGGDASIGGLVGRRSFEDTNNGTLTCSSCSWTSTIRVSGNSSGIYVGGLVGRVDNDGKSGVGMEMSFTDCTISGKLSRTGKPDDARIGGMLGACYGRLNNNATDPLCFNLLIDGVTVDGATVTSDAKNEMGGLLSLEWLNSNVTVKNVVVKDSTVSSTNTSSFGGLVFKATGYCKIEGTQTTDGSGVTTVKSGVTIKSGTFSGPSPAGAPSALLICHGEERGTLNNALYLEILDGAYEIQSATIDIGSSTTFDEIIGTTFGSEGKGNGIVSIATPGDLIYKEANGVKSRNTYEKQLSTDYTNPNTRYYYNLDSFGAVDNPPSGDINSSQNMVMFSAYSHADDSIKGYFYSNPGNITNPTDGIIDLTGYSYYPAEQHATVQNATIKFDFANIETREEGNKKPSDANRQHYGMHTGIFTGAFNQQATLEVSDLILQGTVGGAGSNYGALIRDGASGLNANHMLTLKIGPVTLDGIRVIGTHDVKPLLINKLDSYTKLDISGVTMTDTYTDKTQKAASSLIGDVGNSTSGRDIQLTFSNMELNGKVSESIFSRATFLESFQYANAGCSGVYNFEKPATGTPYTLGKELSNTGGEGSRVSGRNNGKQYWFYNAEQIDENLVCGKKEDGSYNEPAAFFAEGYLRYVYQREGSQENYHEIDINLKAVELAGCGTYSDPYIITGEDAFNLLKQFADAIANKGASTMSMKIMMDPNVLGKTFKDEGKKTENVHTCVKYQYEGGSWKRIDGSTENIPNTTKVLNYLCNAYYKIDGVITIDDAEWAGLGTSDNPFSGVIVGAHSAKVTISNTGSQTQYGGLIKFSQGSVVKDLSIEYTNTKVPSCPTVSTDTTKSNIPSEKSNASFFGGVVGWCLGGDTIIDTVEVTYPTDGVTINGTTNPHLTAVGGYVGMVGGGGPTVQYGGGVVFRGDIGGGLGGKSDNYFYYNPYVGRVLDGYVLSEKTKLDNTDDNYQIPTITAGKHLNIADGTVTVNNAQGLWLLSAIANSGAGAMTDANCLAYNVGKPRTGTYANVGGELTSSMPEHSDETVLGGVGGTDKKRTTCYLSKYVDGDFYNLCSSGVSIVLDSNCDMSGYGNGFRGIGASYATNANDSSNYRLIPVSSVASKTGETYTVTLGQDRKEYTEEKDNWTSIGTGLFVLLRVPNNGSFSASNLTLKGSTGITYYSGLQLSEDGNIKDGNTIIGSLETGKRLSLVGAGMLAGNLAKNGTVDNFSLDGISLTGTNDKKVTVNGNGVGSTNAGGLVGALWNNGTINSVTLTDCEMDNVAVSGRMNVGGFLGYVSAGAVSINYSQNKTLKNIQTTSTQISPRNDNTSGACGVGGLIGYNKSALTINASNATDQTEPPRLTLEHMKVTNSVNNDTADKSHAGGLVGLWVEAKGGTAKIINVTMSGKIEIIGVGDTKPNTSVGGLVGAIQYKLGTWNDDSGNCSLELKGLRIASGKDSDEKNSSMKIKSGRQVGGLFGMAIIQNSFTIDDVIIGGDGCPVTISNTYGMTNQSIAALIGIALDAQNLSITNTQIIHTAVLVKGDGDRGAGLVVGFVQNGPAKIDLRNLTLRDSAVVTQNENLRTGLLYGRIDSSHAHTITGTNILVKNCVSGLMLQPSGNSYSLYNGTMDTFTPSNENAGLNIGGLKPYSVLTGTASEVAGYTSDRKGILGGDSGGKTVKLVGVSIQQSSNTLPMKDFGTAPSSGSYVVRADYTGAANGDASKVTTSPRSSLNTPDKTITGDGASFVKDTTTPVGDQILADLRTTTDSAGGKIQPTNLNLKHSTAPAYGDDATKAYEYLWENSGKAFFGDFKQQGGNSEEDYKGGSFPVLTLVTNSSVDANKLIYSWISLLTNRTINTSSEGVTITPKRYKWSGNAWGIDTTQEQDLPLQWDSTKKEFTLNKGIYDSGQNRFALLDVAFADPADNTKDAYHLYIPVIVQKMLRFRFWASAQTGTTYIKSSYMQQEALAAASHGQQVTVLMGFEYKRTQTEWQEAVNNGDNLLFGFEKTIQLEGTSLPSGTRLTLVDCANQNKVYYAKGSEIEDVQGNRTKHNLSFTKFDGWSPVNLCDMLELSVGTSPGQYYQLKNVTTEEAAKAADATLRVWNGTGYDYYKYYAEEDANRPEGTGVSITVDWNPKTVDDFLREQYYLTIQTPDAESAICNNQIVCSNSLNRAELLPTLREKNDRGGDYTRNGYENRVLIGDFFDQNVTISTEANNNPEMSTVNHVIQATLTSEIKFSSPQSAETFKTYAKGQNLFQSFDLRMQKTEKAGEQAQRINLVPGTRITAEYFLGDTPAGTKTYTIARSTPSFRLDFPKGVDVGDWDAQNGATFKAKLTLEYPDAAILAQFPLINGEPGNLGVNLGTSSYLAYTEDALPTTTIHKDAEWDAHNFYRRDFKAASLNYYPVKRTGNSTVESVNQLGVNGWNQQNSLINSAATYDASALDDAGNAKTLRCTLSLKRKTDDGGYEAVDGWADYLAEGSAPTVSVYYNTPGVNAAVASPTRSGSVYTTQFTLTSYNKDVPIEIRVDMKVLTGAGFEAEGTLIYANYKVEMCVELLDSTGTNVIAGSRAEDYIVYTNARINPNPIRE